MSNNDNNMAEEASEELSKYLNPVLSRFLLNVSKAISQDPGLPHPNPTVSSWQVLEHPIASIQSPDLPQRTDFVVIGSGITGCSVTKTLLEHPAAAGSHVTVLEARTLVSGATGRNGGHLVTAAGHTLGPLARQHGVEAARQITRFSILNIERVMGMVRGMDAELQEECQIRDVRKVMADADEETWAAAKGSVLDFQKAVPEHAGYHKIGHTADGLPIVGRVPGSLLGIGSDDDDGQWIAAGFNGYGMDKCWLTDEALVRMMFGEDVTAWFPQAFLVTEDRLIKTLTADQTLLKFAQIALPGGARRERL
ncbi:FAD dependent oxidoreductase superfamily protein [Colletotrichum sojae]|uniref:FAD dependent oxidoreductase superfamily protein n=1 Tax=Colletotrichum sojae TaxID=2175907 RepID=A0A8H6IN10_9PEZI|nr:FAD dependent oxidoreductase superfamily protein [Colletotrichum sojae]